MIGLTQLLANCAANDVVVSLNDTGGLTVDAPQSALTDELLSELKARKSELVEMLAGSNGREYVDPDDVPACTVCNMQEMWQTMAGDSKGRTPGVWRCMNCDPPTTTWRLLEHAERIRRQSKQYE